MDKERNSDANSFVSNLGTSRPPTESSVDGNDRMSAQILTSFSSVSTIGKSYFPKRKARLRYVDGPLTENTLIGVAEYIKSGKCKNIVLLTGAGISTASGVPDFRTPGTGLYSMFEQANIEPPQSIFDIDYFRVNPEPFYQICKKFINILDDAKPTLTHYFVRLLQNHGVLLRYYTQNVDGLEHRAGVDQSFIVEGHGSLSTASCIDCRAPSNMDHFRRCVVSDTIAYCSKCNGLVKPDIVLFGERLPDTFFENIESDAKNCDLMIVAGTKLSVYPMNVIVQLISQDVPRLLINRERLPLFKNDDDTSSNVNSDNSSVTESKRECETPIMGENPVDKIVMNDGSGEFMDLVIYNRDVVWLGDCDDGFLQLTTLIGWDEELRKLQQSS